MPLRDRRTHKPMTNPDRVRVASFNILHGQTVSSAAAHSTAHLQSPSDGPPSATSLIEAIQEISPTVIGLQEVDRNQQRSGGVHQTQVVADQMDTDQWRFVPTVVGTPGGAGGFRAALEHEREHEFDAPHPDYGVSLVSRLPVTQWRTTVFPAAPVSMPLMVQSNGRPRVLRVRDEQRAAIAACVMTAAGPLTIVTAHLSFVPGYNVRPLRQIRKWFADLPRPLVFVGDFNLPSGVPARVTRMTPLIRESTFPSYRPRIQFDHILVDGLNYPQLTAAEQTARVWQLPVSDHCAVSVDIDLNAGRPRPRD